MFESGSAVLAVPAAAGPEAAGWLDGFDPAAASAGERLDALAVVVRHAAWLASVEARLLASFADDADTAAAADPADREWVSEEVGAVLRLQGQFTKDRMATAAQLVRRLPDTLTLLHTGAITAVQARKLAEATAALDEDACATVQERVLAKAPEQTTSQFRRSLERAVLAAAPRTGDEAHEDELTHRRVFITPAEHGMAWLNAYLTAPEAMRLKTAIWRLAQTRKNHATEAAAEAEAVPVEGGLVEVAPIAVFRADALVELGDRHLADTDPHGTLNRAAPAVLVTVDLATLTGDSDEPGELAGYGPLPAGLARRIAADPASTWHRLVTDPLGNLLDHGRTTYKPPKPLADHVRAQHRTCAFPTCNRRAQECELDHVCPWSDNGTTCPDNLIPLCSRHHHLKHDNNWHIDYQPATSTIEWTSPNGRKYRNPRPD